MEREQGTAAVRRAGSEWGRGGASPPGAAAREIGGWNPPAVLALQRSAGNAAVARAVLARGGKDGRRSRTPRPASTSRRPPSRRMRSRASPTTSTGRRGCSSTSRTGIRSCCGTTRTMERVVVTQEQLEAGRAFFIYSTHYQPVLEQQAESAADGRRARDDQGGQRRARGGEQRGDRREAARRRRVPPAVSGAPRARVRG